MKNFFKLKSIESIISILLLAAAVITIYAETKRQEKIPSDLEDALADVKQLELFYREFSTDLGGDVENLKKDIMKCSAQWNKKKCHREIIKKKTALINEAVKRLGKNNPQFQPPDKKEKNQPFRQAALSRGAAFFYLI